MINLNLSHIHNYNTSKNTKTQHFYKVLHIYKERGGYGNDNACPCYYHITNFISNSVVLMQIPEIGATTRLFNVGPRKFGTDVIKYAPIVSTQNVTYYNIKNLHVVS